MDDTLEQDILRGTPNIVARVIYHNSKCVDVEAAEMIERFVDELLNGNDFHQATETLFTASCSKKSRDATMD